MVSRSVLRLSHILSYGLHGKILLALLGLRAKGRKNTLDIQVQYVNINFADLPNEFDGLRVLHMSDFHIDGNEDITNIVIDLINPLSFDFAFLTGDFRNRVLGDFSKCIFQLKELSRQLNRTSAFMVFVVTTMDLI